MDYAMERQLGSFGAVAFKQDVLRGRIAPAFFKRLRARGLSSSSITAGGFRPAGLTREIDRGHAAANVPRHIYCDHSNLCQALYAAPRSD